MPLYPRQHFGGAPARRLADGCHGGRSRAFYRPVGNRMGRDARDFLPDGGRSSRPNSS
jgi:hypothetical protein